MPCGRFVLCHVAKFKPIQASKLDVFNYFKFIINFMFYVIKSWKM